MRTFSIVLGSALLNLALASYGMNRFQVNDASEAHNMMNNGENAPTYGQDAHALHLSHNRPYHYVQDQRNSYSSAATTVVSSQHSVNLPRKGFGRGILYAAGILLFHYCGPPDFVSFVELTAVGLFVGGIVLWFAITYFWIESVKESYKSSSY